MTRPRRLQKTLRSPLRLPKRRRNRFSRQVKRAVYQHFADGHTHDGPRCPYDPPAPGATP